MQDIEGLHQGVCDSWCVLPLWAQLALEGVIEGAREGVDVVRTVAFIIIIIIT